MKGIDFGFASPGRESSMSPGLLRETYVVQALPGATSRVQAYEAGAVIGETYEAGDCCIQQYYFNIKRRTVLQARVEEPCIVFHFLWTGAGDFSWRFDNLQWNDAPRMARMGYYPAGSGELLLAEGDYRFIAIVLEKKLLAKKAKRNPVLLHLLQLLAGPSAYVHVEQGCFPSLRIGQVWQQLFAPAADEAALETKQCAHVNSLLKWYALQLLHEPAEWNANTIAAYVAANLRCTDDRLSVAQLCKTFGIGKSTLLRKFQEYFAMAPAQYVYEQRMRQAMYYLKDKQTRIRDIPELVGYSELPGFYKAFKKYANMPPSVFREKEVKVEEKLKRMDNIFFK